MARRKRRRSLTQTGSNGGKGRLRLFAVLGVLVAINLYVFLWRAGSSVPAVIKQSRSEKKPASKTSKAPETAPPVATAFSNPVTEVASALPPPSQAATAETAAVSAAKGPAQADTPTPGAARNAQGTVQKRDSLGRILRREGVDVAQADELIRSLRTHLDFRKIRVGQSYSLQVDASGQLQRFKFVLSRTVNVLAERASTGVLVGRRETADTQTRIESISGTIQGSLYKSIKSRGGDSHLVGFFVDVFAYDLNFFVDTHKGDTFKIVVEKQFARGQFLRYGNVLAAEYSGKAGTFQAFYWKAPRAKEGRYFDSKGRSLEKLLLKTPLKFGRVSSKFNRHRMHPILHKVRAHLGVDYAAPTGTPVRAAAEGTITFRAFRRGGGNTVILRHENGLETVYMHLSKFRKGQKRGQRVRGKVVIGYVGSTGMSTGPHLHFALKKNGAYVDPMKMKMTRFKGVPRRQRARFRRSIAPALQKLNAIRVTASPVAAGSSKPAGPDVEIQATHPAYRDQIRSRKASQKAANRRQPTLPK